jgi:hypothetical protein
LLFHVFALFEQQDLNQVEHYIFLIEIHMVDDGYTKSMN